MSGNTVAVMGTFDTKTEEYLYIINKIKELGAMFLRLM